MFDSRCFFCSSLHHKNEPMELLMFWHKLALREDSKVDTDTGSGHQMPFVLYGENWWNYALYLRHFLKAGQFMRLNSNDAID